MHDPDAAVDTRSRRLLKQIDDLKALEARLRRATRGSPEFRALEDEIEATTRVVFEREAAPRGGSRRPPA